MLMRGRKLPEANYIKRRPRPLSSRRELVCGVPRYSRLWRQVRWSASRSLGDQGEGSQGSVGKGKKSAETPLKDPNWARRGPGAGGGDSGGKDEKGGKKRKEREGEKGDGEKGDEKKGARGDLPEGQEPQLCWCEIQAGPVGFEKGSRCSVCAAQEAAKQQRQPTLKVSRCTKARCGSRGHARCAPWRSNRGMSEETEGRRARRRQTDKQEETSMGETCT